jgi:L-threonylcarbamoyladenylate synthase
VIRLDASAPEARDQAIKALAAGRVVAFPTDTAYGFGVRPDAPAAADAVYRLKGRRSEMPLVVLAGDTGDLGPWAVWSDLARSLAKLWWPGPLTLVLPAGPRTPPHLRAADGTVGIRVPDCTATSQLLAIVGPLATTSANRSGAASPRTAAEVARAFAGDDEPAVLLDGGPTSREADSTVLSLAGTPRILRQGAISAFDLGLALTCD